MGIQFFNRKIAEECHQQMRAFAKAGDEPICVAFPSGGGDQNRWSVVAKSGAYYNRNIPAEAHQHMHDLSTNGARVTRVAFTPGGGWSIGNDKGAYLNRNIPAECHQKMAEMSNNGAKVVLVAFPPQGGNSWSIVNDKGAYFNRNIPEECHRMMGELSKHGAKITCVAFPPQGGNSFSIVNDKGAFWNRNVPDELHVYMGWFTQVYGPVTFVAFDTDGSGWSVGSHITITEKVCDKTHRVSIADVYNNVAEKLKGKVVGYACTVGSASLGAFSWGQGRTDANAPARMYLPTTKSPTASVSKVVTTLAAIRLLANHGISLDSGIGGHLPSDWKLDPHVSAITFRQLLSHRSGIKDYGNNAQDYETLKRFFTQSVDPTQNQQCQGPDVQDPANPINPNHKSPCYSNYNFSIFRVLLPIIDGFTDSSAERPAKLAAAYIKIVQRLVFEPVGILGVDAKPPTSGPFAFAYKYPGTASGWNWGDNTLGVGAAGWWLNIEDIGKVLYSLNKNDGRILTPAQLNDMVATPMGWDVATVTADERWIEKNGGWGTSSGTSISTSIALFGGGIYGALFLNSDVLGPGLQNNWQWCRKCQAMSYAGYANLGPCPAGGLHDHKGSRNFCLPTGESGPPNSRPNWRWCKKCEALFFAGGTSAGTCSGGGNHDHTGSWKFFLEGRAAGDLPQDYQEHWALCNKCHVLAYAPYSFKSSCSAGGKHDHTDSGNYIIQYVVGADTVLYEAYQKAKKPKV